MSGSQVYVGGGFDAIGGAKRKGIAAIDATSGRATSWDAHLDGSVDTIATAGGTLYVGGDFTSAGGTERLNAAALDSVTGAALPWAPDPSDRVDALAPGGSSVALGGAFTGLGGVARGGLAAIDLTTGRPTDWNPNLSDVLIEPEIDALGLSGGKLYIAGLFDHALGHPRYGGLAAFDLATGALDPWSPRIRLQGGVQALAVAGKRLYIAGQFGLVDGKRRSDLAAFALPSHRLLPLHPGFASSCCGAEVDSIAVTHGTVYLSGFFEKLDGKPERQQGLAAVDASNGRIRSNWRPSPKIETGGTDSDLAVAGKRIYVAECLGGGSLSSVLALSPRTGRSLPWSSTTVNRQGGDFDECATSVTYAAPWVIVGGWLKSFGKHSSVHGAAILSAANGAVEPWKPQLDDYVSAISARGGDVIVGGNFRNAGKLPQSYLAEFGG